MNSKLSLLVKNHGQCVEISRIFHEKLQLRSFLCRRKPDNRRSCHPISQNNASGTSRSINRLATSVRARHQTALRCCHRHRVFASVQQQRPHNPHRDLHIANRHFAALPQNRIVIESVQRHPNERSPCEPLHRLASYRRCAMTVTEF